MGSSRRKQLDSPTEGERLAYLVGHRINFVFRVRHLDCKYFATEYGKQLSTEHREIVNRLILFRSVTGGLLIGRIAKYDSILRIYKVATIPAVNKSVYGVNFYFMRSTEIKTFYINSNQVIAILKEMK